MLHRPPSEPAWMVRWATQDFIIWTALTVMWLTIDLWPSEKMIKIQT